MSDLYDQIKEEVLLGFKESNHLTPLHRTWIAVVEHEQRIIRCYSTLPICIVDLICDWLNFFLVSELTTGIAASCYAFARLKRQIVDEGPWNWWNTIFENNMKWNGGVNGWNYAYWRHPTDCYEKKMAVRHIGSFMNQYHEDYIQSITTCDYDEQDDIDMTDLDSEGEGEGGDSMSMSPLDLQITRRLSF